MSERSECEFCSGEFEHTAIKEYGQWTVQLFLDQKYLGRTLVKLNRHEVDFFNIEDDERNKLFSKVIPDLKNALDRLFEPDLYNYASLGNDCRHLHIHIIPRYKSSREFQGLEFKDDNWNQHYITDERFMPEEKLFKQIRDSIKEEFDHDRDC